MRLLVDNALSPGLAVLLQAQGHQVVHVRDLGLQAASDAVIFDQALKEDRIVVSADTDFGTLLALRQTSKPSVILFRGDLGRRPEQQAALLQANLPQLQESLNQGSLVVFEPNRIRIRSLPISQSDR